MTQGDLPEDLVLTEAQFREVIKRATRAELRDPGIPLDTLRQVAGELDIDPKQLERALRSVVDTPDRPDTVRDWFERTDIRIGRLLGDILPRRARAAVGALVGGSLGWLSAHVASTVATGANAFIDVPVAIALILLTGANSLSRRLDGQFARFVGETIAMWAAFGLAWTLTSGKITGDIVTWVLFCVGVATTWGWIAVRKPGPGAPTALREVHPPGDDGRASQLSDESSSLRTSMPDSGVSSVAFALVLPHLRRNGGTIQPRLAECRSAAAP